MPTANGAALWEELEFEEFEVNYDLPVGQLFENFLHVPPEINREIIKCDQSGTQKVELAVLRFLEPQYTNGDHNFPADCDPANLWDLLAYATKHMTSINFLDFVREQYLYDIKATQQRAQILSEVINEVLKGGVLALADHNDPLSVIANVYEVGEAIGPGLKIFEPGEHMTCEIGFLVKKRTQVEKG